MEKRRDDVVESRRAWHRARLDPPLSAADHTGKQNPALPVLEPGCNERAQHVAKPPALHGTHPVRRVASVDDPWRAVVRKQEGAQMRGTPIDSDHVGKLSGIHDVSSMRWRCTPFQ